MRPILAATAILAVFTVSGCDINTGGGKPASADCHCAAPVAAAPAPVATTASAAPAEYHHRYHYRHRGYGARYAGWHAHGYYWRKEYSEISVATYDYHGGSHSYYVGGHEGGASAYAGAGEHGGGDYHAVDGGWVDGFGRGHGGHAGTPVHYEARADEHDRMKPWHGYDADCPDGDDHAHH